MSARVRVMANGRMSLPMELRKRYGLERGGEVLVEDRDGELVLRTVAQSVARAQAISRRLLRGRGDAGVDDFLAARRREAAEE